MTRAQARPGAPARPGRPGGGPAEKGVAGVIASLAGTLGLATLPVRIRAWDGSEAGPDSGPVVLLRSPRALRRLLWHPGELGLAQAYVTGELDVDGDLEDGLRRAWDAAAAVAGRTRRPNRRPPPPRRRWPRVRARRPGRRPPARAGRPAAPARQPGPRFRPPHSPGS